MHGAVLVQPGALPRKSDFRRPKGGKKVISGVLTGSRFFRLRKPICVNERDQNGIWVHECKPLRIYTFGETREESWRTFVEFFECNWDSIARQKDSKLTLDAQELKRTYLDIVESVDRVL